MATPVIKGSFAAGELAPSLWGRTDLAKWHIGATVLRNMFVNYRGGASSRAGLGFTGQSLQAGTALPPRIIPFRFNIFQNYILEFGEKYIRVVADGAYVTESSLVITAISQANPAVATIPGHTYTPGQWIFLGTIGGMTQLNSRTVVVGAVSGNNVTLNDTFGSPIDSLAFPAYVASSGTAARIFTLTTPYAAADLAYLKFTQSADVMSLCCVNPQTGTEYATQDLTRLAANNWTITPTSFGTSIAAPGSPSAVASSAGSAAYGYVITAISAATGEESVASAIASVTSAVDIASTFGTISLSWSAVTGASGYNIYRATPDYTNTGNFTGQLFGYVGSTDGAVTWKDTNIIADFVTTPPKALNPFSGTGNAPMEVAYFQQRRGYFGSLNNPDTYNFSQPGAYKNFDSADPPIDSDAIQGNPWAQQVNGLQFAIPMPGGLITFTGLDAWQLAGTGGAGTPITPSQQSAQPQDSYGCSATMQPIRIGDHILYWPQAGTSVQDMAYNFWNNMYAGQEISILSSHLFINYQPMSWALARQPWKIVWAVRDDGRLLSLTYMKEQEVIGWARHDTNGLFMSAAVATELPVDAPYFVVKRYIPGPNQWAYYIERMDDRRWANVEECFCIDAGLRLPQPTPNATLTASVASPSNGAVAGPVIVGGSNYTTGVQAYIHDNGPGLGAVVSSITVVGGAITSFVIDPPGENYAAPYVEFTDSTGSGATAEVLVDNNVQFQADAPVFSAPNVGAVIRMGGGIATITGVVSPTLVNATMTSPITAVVPNDPLDTPLPAASGEWTMTTPVTTISGLDHLEGMTVTGLADGAVIPRTVVAGGQITLATPASAVAVGLGYSAQLQSMHTDVPGRSTVQGDAILIAGVTVRVEGSRDFALGQDMPIASAQPNQAEYPWTDLAAVQTRNRPSPQAGAPAPLYTGDRYVPIKGDWNLYNNTPNDSVPMPGEAPRAPGMVAAQQDNPLPMNILALIPQIVVGDSDGPQDLAA